MTEKNKEILWKSIVYVLSIIVVAGLGTLFVNIGMSWFDSLLKPAQWIPNFVIPIVWTVIYLTFAVLGVVTIVKKQIPRNIIVFLIINGALNVLWCLTFFTLKQLFIGNIVIIINLIFAFILLNEIKKYNKTFYWILLIYPIWISIATTLNTSLWILN